MKYLALPLHHHFLDLGDGFSRIESFWAGCCAVHDGMAAVEAEWIFQIIEPFALMVVPTIC